jgi:hypothetical protein
MRHKHDKGDKHDKGWAELDEHDAAPAMGFLPDEQSENNQVAITDLRGRVTRLEQQTQALYTSMASYATIAERNTELARQEARADLDRSQSTVIGLVEKVRRDLSGQAPSGYGGVAAAAVSSDRVLRLDERLDALTAMVEQLAREQHELHQNVARLVERDMAANGWLVSDGPAERLSLA